MRLTPDKLGIEVTQNPANFRVSQIAVEVNEELEECIGNGGAGQVPQTVSLAHAGAGIHNHKAVAVTTRRYAISKANVHAECVTNWWDMGL